jgi:hypothetical protein
VLPVSLHDDFAPHSEEAAGIDFDIAHERARPLGARGDITLFSAV